MQNAHAAIVPAAGGGTGRPKRKWVSMATPRSLPHPLTGQLFCSPVPPGTGWPEDVASATTPIARTAAQVNTLAGAKLVARRTGRTHLAVPGMPTTGEMARRRRTGEAARVRRPAVLGQADAGVGRSVSASAHRRIGAGSQRREPYRPDVHRRPIGGLAFRLPVSPWPGHTTYERARRRWSTAGRRPDDCHPALRPT